MKTKKLLYVGKNEIGEKEFIGTKQDWEKEERAEDDLFADRANEDARIFYENSRGVGFN